jgi:hypothetical protein
VIDHVNSENIILWMEICAFAPKREKHTKYQSKFFYITPDTGMTKTVTYDDFVQNLWASYNHQNHFLDVKKIAKGKDRVTSFPKLCR